MDRVKRRRSHDSSLIHKLFDRRVTGKTKQTELWAEDESVFHQQLEYLELPAATTRSTIALAFSHDGTSFASTHGDHTIKITTFLTKKTIQTLRGHSRTPWTVKFHPKDSRIVASGCLAFEVRVWNVPSGTCLHVAKLQAALISLNFHPSGDVLAIASGQCVHLWDYNNKPRPREAWRHAHIIRCVRFTPDGAGIIVGAANNSNAMPQAHLGATTRGRKPAQTEVTFRLEVWNFSLEAVLAENGTPAMNQPRKLLGNTLLYNDGGFDMSKDGLWLCAIAKLRRVVGNPPLAMWATASISAKEMRYGADDAATSKQPTSAASGMTNGAAAPCDGSQLVRGQSLGTKWSKAKPGASRVEDVGGIRYKGRQQASREKGTVQGGHSLAPWPTRARSKPWFQGVIKPGKTINVDDNGVELPSTPTGAATKVPRKPQPHTPSPRIRLKRRLSGAWKSSDSGNGEREKSWFNEPQRKPGSKTLVIDRSFGARKRACLGEKEGSADGSSSNVERAADASGAVSRSRGPIEGEENGKTPAFLKGDLAGGLSGRIEGVNQNTRRLGESRPPSLPPSTPPPFIFGGVFSSPVNDSSSVIPPSPSSSPSALSGELRSSLPFLLAPPAISSSSQHPESAPAVQTIADNIVRNPHPATEERSRETRQQRRRREETLSLFFLQVPPDLGERSDSYFAPSPNAREAREGAFSGDINHGNVIGRLGEDRSAKKGGGREDEIVRAEIEPGYTGSWGSRGGCRRAPPWQGQPPGDFVPHLVLVSLHAGAEEGLTRVVHAADMDVAAAKQVTSVQLSPSGRYILLGAGIRGGRSNPNLSRLAHEGTTSNGRAQDNTLEHPVTSIYRASDLQPVARHSTGHVESSLARLVTFNLMPTADDDVNIACFHPEPGMGCVYGTKQGRVCLVRLADR